MPFGVRRLRELGVEIGRDSRIDPGVVITGESRLGERVHVKPHCVIESSRLDDDVQLGPSAHLRPNCHLRSRVKIGNYVEVKNSDVGEGVKAAHLTYIGDTDVGAGTTFGCGVITVNYDGEKKSRTTVGDRVFIGEGRRRGDGQRQTGQSGEEDPGEASHRRPIHSATTSATSFFGTSSWSTLQRTQRVKASS